MCFVIRITYTCCMVAKEKTTEYCEKAYINDQGKKDCHERIDKWFHEQTCEGCFKAAKKKVDEWSKRTGYEGGWVWWRWC